MLHPIESILISRCFAFGHLVKAFGHLVKVLSRSPGRIGVSGRLADFAKFHAMEPLRAGRVVRKNSITPR
jgi:hypothetical protein